MEGYPSTNRVRVNQGGVECVIGTPGARIPVTIDGSRLGAAAAKVTIQGPALYGRRADSPNKAVPFMNSGVISDPTNTTNATVDIPDADAARFKVGDVVTFYDVTAGAMSAESLTLDVIGAAGSGGAGVTLLTFTAEVWSTPPEAADLLVVADGAQLSVNAVVILEDVEFDGSTDIPSSAFINGQFVKSVVGRTTYFVQSENQVVQLVAID